MIFDGPENAEKTFILAHGAGSGMDTPFMNLVAKGVAACGVRVVRFEFPYMAARRTGKKRGAPDRPPVLMASWRDAIAENRSKSVFIGGKSMGGRIATMVADESGVRGVVCLGYPFHPPRDPTRLRTEHLRELRTPTLIIQGERDPFGTREEVAKYDLSPAIRIEWMPDGDHSLRPRAASGHTEGQNVTTAIQLICDFLSER